MKNYRSQYALTVLDAYLTENKLEKHVANRILMLAREVAMSFLGEYRDAMADARQKHFESLDRLQYVRKRATQKNWKKETKK